MNSRFGVAYKWLFSFTMDLTFALLCRPIISVVIREFKGRTRHQPVQPRSHKDYIESLCLR